MYAYAFSSFTGAIVGIVIAALVIAAAIVAVIVLLVVYRVKTGEWFKLSSRDEDGMEFHFSKDLLIGDVKPSRFRVLWLIFQWRKKYHSKYCTGRKL